MAQIDVLKAQIVRENVETPWGFRIQGGKDTNPPEPVTIQRVTPGSPAGRVGLKTGDEITEIGEESAKEFTNEEAKASINKNGLSLTLTVERRSTGAIPVQVVTPRPEPQKPIKSYQTYDMTGKKPQFFTAVARPFDQPKPRQRTRPQPPASLEGDQEQGEAPVQVPAPATAPAPAHAPAPAPAHVPARAPPHTYIHDQNDHRPRYPRYEMKEHLYKDYYPEYYGYNPSLYQPTNQSRTFTKLESIMRNEEKYGGNTALPPPRSAYIEQQRHLAEMRQLPSPTSSVPHGMNPKDRVKVFMAQQYNNPMGLYSAKNVVDTFQTQAETQLQMIEK